MACLTRGIRRPPDVVRMRSLASVTALNPYLGIGNSSTSIPTAVSIPSTHTACMKLTQVRRTSKKLVERCWFLRFDFPIRISLTVTKNSGASKWDVMYGHGPVACRDWNGLVAAASYRRRDSLDLFTRQVIDTDIRFIDASIPALAGSSWGWMSSATSRYSCSYFSNLYNDAENGMDIRLPHITTFSNSLD